MNLQNVRISLRTDSLSNWELYNPVLNNGEFAVAVLSDGTQTLKIGNGISSYNQIPLSNLDNELWEQVRTKVVHGEYQQNFKNLHQLSIINIEQSAFYDIVDKGEYLSDAIYVVEPKYLDAFHQNVKNVADPVEKTDAVNLKYLESALLSTSYIGNYASGEYNFEKGTLSVARISQSDYANLTSSGEDISDIFYSVKQEYLDAYSKRIVNVASPSVATDAVNKMYLESRISSIKLSDYYEKTETSSASQLNTKFNDYYNKSAIDTKLTAYETKADLTANYYNKSAIDTKLTSLTSYLTKGEASSTYETKADLSVKINSLSSKIENKVKIGLYNDGSYNLSSGDLSVVKINEEDYYRLVAKGKILSNAVYILSSENINARDKRLVNLAEPQLSNDGTTKSYVDSKVNIGNYISGNYNLSQKAISAVNIDAEDYYELANMGLLNPEILYVISSETPNAYGQRILNVKSPELSSDAANKGYVDEKIGSFDLSDYYKKSETSSNVQLSSEFSNKIRFGKYENGSYGELSSGNLSTVSISQEDYYELIYLSALNPNVLYVVNKTENNAYDRKIINVKTPEISSDAATMGYVDNVSVDLMGKIDIIDIDYKNYTAFEVFPTNVVISSGTYDSNLYELDALPEANKGNYEKYLNSVIKVGSTKYRMILSSSTYSIVETTDSTIAEIFGHNVDAVTGLPYTVDVPAVKIAGITVKVDVDKDDSDLIIDWGDGNVIGIKDMTVGATVDGTTLVSYADADSTSDNYDDRKVEVKHEYSDDKCNYRYKVKIFGTHTSLKSYCSGTTCICSRILEYDLPVSKHLLAMSATCKGSDRLLRLNILCHFDFKNIMSMKQMFLTSKNLKKIHVAEECNIYNKDICSFAQIFDTCTVLTDSDFHIPSNCSNSGNYGYYRFYADCIALSSNVKNLLPISSGGFAKRNVSLAAVFYGCTSITGSLTEEIRLHGTADIPVKMADILWLDTSKNWIHNQAPFGNCTSLTDYASVPTGWR